MKIELKNRFIWVGRAQRAIERVMFIRDYEDARFENDWYDRYHRKGWLSWFGRPKTEFPTLAGLSNYDIIFYPSSYGRGTLLFAKSFIAAATSSDVGDIYITEGEFNTLKDD